MGGSDDTDWKFQTCFQSFCDRHELGQKWQSAKDYGTENPGSTLFIIAVVAMCSFPIFCFLAFVVGSLIIGFTIFLFVEGTVLTIAAFLLGGALFFASLFSVGFSIFAVLAIYSFSTAQKIISKVSSKTPSSGPVTECDSTQKDKLK
uniref:Promethin n=1 Tax=Magallana gigas TaxID=29159 RepID=A0A8W8ICD6_MAGGI